MIKNNNGGMIKQLENKIREKSARIAVIGLGYVGLPIAVEFARRGFAVIGIDNDERKIHELTSGHSYVNDIPGREMARLIHTKAITATIHYEALLDADCISVCVPTPLNKTKDPDVSYLVEASCNIKKFLRRGQLVCLESTTYPGTTRELILPILSEGGLNVGSDFFLAFSPERIDPGNKTYTIRNIPKVVAGITSNCTRAVRLLYSQIVERTVLVSSPEAAEMTKLLENTFRIVNIGLVNELAIMCDKLRINVWEVIDAASTKPFGFMKFYPGPGLGGHCIPVDPHYLSWKLKFLKYKARFIELAGEINSEMPEYVVRKIGDGLNNFKKAINGSNILLIGVAYKRDIDDIRESPALDILELLRAKGAQVYYHDPYVPALTARDASFQSDELTGELVQSMDCVVIVTDHSDVNYNLIKKMAKLVVDTRNVFPKGGDNIIRL